MDDEYIFDALEKITLLEGSFVSWLSKDITTFEKLKEICDLELYGDPALMKLWLEQPHFLINENEEKIYMFCCFEPKEDVKIYDFVFRI